MHTRTEEMRPQWFRISGERNLETPPIPYEKLWESDYLWLPLLLQKRNFIARTDYTRDGDREVLQKWCVKEINTNA